VLNAVGVSGLLPKRLISMYLVFLFPSCRVGMSKGLRASDQMQLDQMRTWHAKHAQRSVKGCACCLDAVFSYLRLRLLCAASLVGAIIGELPNGGGSAGLGRVLLLAGSYYGPDDSRSGSALICGGAGGACWWGSLSLDPNGLTLKRYGDWRDDLAG